MAKYGKKLFKAINNNKIVYYDYQFINQLPNYNFLGTPIKEVLNSDYSSHECVLALSTYFKEFEIITCNLGSSEKNSILKININNKNIIIDTTLKFITDVSTYYNIFEPKNIRTIKSEEINNTLFYKYIKYYRNNNKIDANTLNKYFEICNNCKDYNNSNIEYFISLILQRTTKKCNKKLLYNKQ